MGKVIFSIKYGIQPEKRNEYLGVIRELKSLVKAEGLESYSVYEEKNKQNNFSEVYVFANEDAYEKFDDIENERIDILMSKLSDMIMQQSTHYSTMFEVVE